MREERTGARSSGEASSPRGSLLLSLHLPAAALGLGTGITMPVLPVLARSFDVSVGVAALVFIVHMLGSAAGTLPTGYAIDRFGRRKVLLAGPVITAAAAFLIAGADSFPELLAYRFIGGVGQQMWTLSRLTVIADSGSSQRGRQITSMFGAQRVGSLTGPLIGGFAAAAWGFQVPFLMQGAVTLLAVVPTLFVMRNAIPDRPAPPHPASGETPSFGWRTFLVRPIPAVFGAQWLANVSRGGIEGGGILFLFGVYAYDATAATLGVLTSIMAAAGIPVMLAGGFVMDRFGRKFTIVPGSLLLAAGLVFTAATAFFGWPFEAFVVSFVALHLAASSMAGSMQTLGTDIAPAYARGRFFGVSRLMAQSGRIGSPASFALLTELVSFGAAFVFLSVTALASGAIIAFFVSETLRRDVEAGAPASTDAST